MIKRFAENKCPECCGGTPVEHIDGEYVLYSDYIEAQSKDHALILELFDALKRIEMHARAVTTYHRHGQKTPERRIEDLDIIDSQTYELIKRNETYIMGRLRMDNNEIKTQNGHGTCSDCQWGIHPDSGCNVDRDSNACNKNRKPIEEKQ
jgi:hypothetical protein